MKAKVQHSATSPTLRFLGRFNVLYWLWPDASLGVVKITSNITVRGSIFQEIIVSVGLDDFIHDPVCQYKSTSNHC